MEKNAKPKTEWPGWYEGIKKYEQKSLFKAILQILNTFIPYFILLALMVYTVKAGFSYLITFAISIVAAGFLVRIFVIFHDCTHNSFFKSHFANKILGYAAGVLTLTAYDDWQWCHTQHHQNAGDLERQGVGSISVMTVKNYQTASKLKQVLYRIGRHPIVLFGLAPSGLFILSQRFTKGPGKKQRESIIITNFLILVILLTAGSAIGFGTLLKILAPVMLMAGAAGIWLFFIQHNFAGMYWAHHNEVNKVRVALEGSSFYDLPGILRWFTACIGYHNLHHVRTGIPNYNLKTCYENTPELWRIKPVTIRGSLKAARLHLWDDENNKLVGFSALGK